MSAPHTAETPTAFLEVPQSLAQAIERSANEHHSDVPTLLRAALAAYHSASVAPDPDHDAWFRTRVQQALDDPRPLLSHEEVKAHFARRREALRQRTLPQAAQ